MTARHGLKKLWLKRFINLSLNFVRIALRMIPIAAFFGVIVFFGDGVKTMLYADPYFNVSRVTIFPFGVLTPSELKFLQAEVMTKNVFQVELPRVANVLMKNPRIGNAEVDRSFPGEVHIWLQVRELLVQVQLKKQGRFYVIGKDQFVIEEAAVPYAALLTLEDYESKNKSLTLGTLYENKDFQQLALLIESIRKEEVLEAETVTRIALDRLDNWTLILNDGISIKLGKEPFLNQNKRAIIKSILRSSERKDLLYIDARYEDIIIKKK